MLTPQSPERPRGTQGRHEQSTAQPQRRLPVVFTTLRASFIETSSLTYLVSNHGSETVLKPQVLAQCALTLTPSSPGPGAR